MQKRGQSTQFATIAIVIIAAALLITYQREGTALSKTNLKESLSLPPHVESVRELTQSCLDQTANDGLLLTLMQGGYYQVPRNSVKTPVSNVVYWLFQGKKTIPSLQDIENQLSAFVKDNIDSCLDFSKVDGVSVKKSASSVSTSIEDDLIIFNLNMPMMISKGGTSSQLKSTITTEIQSNLNDVYNTASEIIEKSVRSPNMVDATLLINSGYYAEVMPLDEKSIIYAISDKNSNINNLPLILMFAVER